MKSKDGLKLSAKTASVAITTPDRAAQAAGRAQGAPARTAMSRPERSAPGPAASARSTSSEPGAGAKARLRTGAARSPTTPAGETVGTRTVIGASGDGPSSNEPSGSIRKVAKRTCGSAPEAGSSSMSAMATVRQSASGRPAPSTRPAAPRPGGSRARATG